VAHGHGRPQRSGDDALETAVLDHLDDGARHALG
jgi:hypothetical protein